MAEAFICDGVRTAIGRYAGGLAKVRTDDLAAVPLKALMKRHPGLDWSTLDEVYFGCANQAGEDNRNVARMALLLSGLPSSVPGVTVNRLCASGLNAIGVAAQAIRAGEADFVIAGGVESMTRAPLVMGKAQEAFQRSANIEDTTIGWRFVNPLMKAQYGVDAMPETAENVAEDYQVARKDQDAFALRSQQRAAKAQADGYFAEEIVDVEVPGEAGLAALEVGLLDDAREQARLAGLEEAIELVFVLAQPLDRLGTDLQLTETTQVSSDQLAALANVNAAKVRKDLSYLGTYGTRGVGYEVAFLIYQIKRELGLLTEWKTIVIGAATSVLRSL